MGNLRIGPYLAFVSKSWAVEDVITRSRTASGDVVGADDLLWPKVECVEEELAMPLTTTGEPGYYEASTDNIGFWMLNGTRERQRCAVTLEALEKVKAERYHSRHFRSHLEKSWFTGRGVPSIRTKFCLPSSAPSFSMGSRMSSPAPILPTALSC